MFIMIVYSAQMQGGAGFSGFAGPGHTKRVPQST